MGPKSSEWFAPFEAFGVGHPSPAVFVDELPADVITPSRDIKYGLSLSFKSIGTFASGYYFGYGGRLWRKADASTTAQEVLGPNGDRVNVFRHVLGDDGRLHIETSGSRVTILDTATGAFSFAPEPPDTWAKVNVAPRFPSAAGLMPVHGGVLYNVRNTPEYVKLDPQGLEVGRWSVPDASVFVHSRGIVARTFTGQSQYIAF